MAQNTDICEIGGKVFTKHKPRDNRFGITWCTHCGRLFTKPCGKELEKEKQLI